VPATTVPAANINPATASTIPLSSRRSARASGRAGATSSVQRTYSITVTATIAIDTRKCTETMAGLSAVSTVMPPSTACKTMPPGCAAASQIRSVLRRVRPSAPMTRNRHAATKTATATAMTTNVNNRLPNSTHVFTMV